MTLPDNTSKRIDDRVRDILFDYGSTNKSVNLGEAKSLIMEEITKAQFKELTDIGKLLNGSRIKLINHYEERYKYLSEHKPHKRNGEDV